MKRKNALHLVLWFVLLNVVLVFSIESDVYKSSVTQKVNEEIKWYGYWPQEVTLNGNLMEAIAFGPPNYGENPKTAKADKIEKYYYIKLDKSISVKGDNTRRTDSSLYRINEISANQFRSEYKYQYKLINEVLARNGINLADGATIPSKQLTIAFNEMISIPNLLQLLESNESLSSAQAGKVNLGTIYRNKDKLIRVYPLTFEKSQKVFFPTDSMTELNINEIQLAIDWRPEKSIVDVKKFNEMMGKNIVVKGTLFHSFTGHHRRKVLIDVQKIQLSNNK